MLLIFFGAGVGGLLRYWIGGAVQHAWAGGFPIGTLVVNVSGCLVMGFLASAFTGPWLVREELRIGLLIGVLGGYTTFSTFGRETLALLQDRQWLSAGMNIAISNLLGLAAVWAGWVAASKLLGGGDGT
ncbi:MAG: fluoride efflux transporter CrcB [Phycisphaerae bacterium]|nr:fluoride efflux transporter CrcB [Phycisphaerae bacterium]